MAPTDLDHGQSNVSSERTGRLAREEHATTTTTADTIRALTERFRADLLNYQEIEDYMSPAETEYDRNLQEQASRAEVMPIELCSKLANEKSTGIIQDWRMLRFLAVYLEPIVQKRWREMTLARKRQLLLEVWPDMSAKHRPDLECLMSQKPIDRDPQSQEAYLKTSYQAYLWPYMNLEDLLAPNALLMFINSRAHSHPNVFALSDLEKATLGKTKKQFLALGKDKAAMAFVVSDSAERYGEIRYWQDDKDVEDSIKAGRTVHVDHGMQILEIQGTVYAFLRQCVRIVLKDIIEAIMSGTYPPPPPVPPQPLTMNNGSCRSKYIFAREAPYRIPTEIDWSHLQALVKAQKDLALDHVIALTDDPGYFAEVTEQYRSHRPELLLDKYGGAHPHAADFPLINKAQRQMAADAHHMLFAWHEVFCRIAKLRDMTLKSGFQTSVDEDLPTEYFDALVETRFLLETISLDLIDVIGTKFRPSPALRKYHFLSNPEEKNPRVMETMQYRHLDQENKVLHRVLELVRIFNDRGRRKLIGLHVVLDEFERLMQDEPGAKDLISSHLASDISQLSIFSECLDQLHHLQPWAQKIESTIAENKFEYRAQYDETIRHWGMINVVHEEFRTQRLFNVGNPRDGKFDYPAEETRTRETVRAMISAEAALRTFWTAANAHWRRYVGTTPAALVSHIIGDRKPHQTPPWVEPTTNISKLRLPHDASLTSAPFFGHSHDISKQITGNFNKLAVVEKVKKKTRGSAATKVNEVAVPDFEEAEAALRTIAVDRRAHRVFGNLFHSPDSKDQPGQVAWIDFLHAMTKAGFGAEKLQGSAWHFTPQNQDIDRSIQFHEPHPSSNMPIKWARRCGRRLTRAFDWTRETFTFA